MNTLNRVVIFGATSAIAEQTARQLVQRGASLYCVGRDPAKLSAMLDDLRIRAGQDQVIGGTSIDLTNIEQHDALIQQAAEILGGLDGALIAHGSLPDQPACEQDFEQTLHALQLNGLSAISLMTRLANHFEQQGHGTLACISSVAGDRGRQSNYVYGTAKGMITLFMQGLRNRLHGKGVSVVTIKPGFVDTPMTAEFDTSGPLWARADQVATGIVTAMVKGKSEVYLPGFWRLIMLIIRHIPETVFKRLSL